MKPSLQRYGIGNGSTETGTKRLAYPSARSPAFGRLGDRLGDPPRRSLFVRYPVARQRDVPLGRLLEVHEVLTHAVDERRVVERERLHRHVVEPRLPVVLDDAPEVVPQRALV